MTNMALEDAPNMSGRFTAVANSLRELADRLEKFNIPWDPSHLLGLNGELKQIGWNALFVGSTMDTLIDFDFPRSDLSYRYNLDRLRQVDSLFVAVNYLLRSVRVLKSGATHELDQEEEVKKALRKLGVRLSEVACECQRA
jgi:hypothetical protein